MIDIAILRSSPELVDVFILVFVFDFCFSLVVIGRFVSRKRMPNVYVYAANNPSESILAKRRGYGTIISHNVSHTHTRTHAQSNQTPTLPWDAPNRL